MRWKPILKWTPRILIMLVIAFFLLMSFDVFGTDDNLWMELAGFLIHNIPTMIMAGLSWLSWKSPKWGGYSFLTLGVVFFFFFKGYSSFMQFLIVVFPVLLIGGMLILDSYKRKE